MFPKQGLIPKQKAAAAKAGGRRCPIEKTPGPE